MPEFLNLSEPAHAATPSIEPTCLNCSAELVGPSYCGHCGQKASSDDPTLSDFLREMTVELTELDRKIPQTIIALLARPGLLTADWFAGRRQRWISPLRLYLIASVAFFLTGPTVERITHRSTREAVKLTMANKDGTASLTPAIRAELANGLPARIIGVEQMERAVTHSAALNAAISAAFPKAMFLLLPLFALLTSVAWRGRRRRYPAHVYLALHLHAAWFIAFAIVTAVTAFVESDAVQMLIVFAAFLYVSWYALVAFRRVFGEPWGRTVAKSAAIGALYAPAWIAASLGLLAYALATM